MSTTLHRYIAPSSVTRDRASTSALPAAYTEFLFGDCAPFLDRETPGACHHIFAALPSREELEYSLLEDSEPHVVGSRFRFDTPEFYAVFASFLRTL